ncbi:MAG: hypothetical protein WDA08_04500 [Weeksellaceae bacterium]
MENIKNTPTDTPQTIEEGKTIAMISYLTLIGLIIAFVMNNDKKNSFAAFHIRQSLGIGLTGLVLSFLNVIPILGQLVFILGFVTLFILWVLGFIGALKGERKLVPILGSKYQEWLKGI